MDFAKRSEIIHHVRDRRSYLRWGKPWAFLDLGRIVSIGSGFYVKYERLVLPGYSAMYARNKQLVLPVDSNEMRESFIYNSALFYFILFYFQNI